MEGSATFTIVLSSRIIACPRHIATSVSLRRRGSSSGIAGSAAGLQQVTDLGEEGDVRRRRGGLLIVALVAREQRVHGLDDEEEHHRGDDEERDERVDERAVS